MLKNHKFQIIGVFFIIISLILIFTDFISAPIRFLTQPILMGSSKGKDIIFFLMIGVFFLLSEIENSKLISKISWPKFLKKDKNTYIRYIFYLLIFLGIFGLIGEITIRLNLNIGIFTIFNVMTPNMTSTSILHSHIYKSVLGIMINYLISYIPTGIHTGSSLEPYIPFYNKILFLLIPVVYLMMLKAIQNQKTCTRITLCVGFSMGIIGLIDGGFFSTPFLGAIGIILVTKYNTNTFSYAVGVILNKKSWIDSVKDDKYVIRHRNDYKAIFKNLIPYIIIISLILLRFTVAYAGSNPEYYEVDIINPDDSVNLDMYNTIKIIETNNKIESEISPEYNELELENSLARGLNGKCEYYTMSWNTYSF